ncbi:hypothetical protein [Promicromonospora soli]
MRIVGRSNTPRAGERGAASLQCVEQGGGTAGALGSLDVNEDQVNTVCSGSRDRLDRAKPAAVIGEKAQTGTDCPQASSTVALGERKLCLDRVVLHPHGQRCTRQGAGQLGTDSTGGTEVTRKNEPARGNQPRDVSWVITKGGTSLVTGLGDRYRLPRPATGDHRRRTVRRAECPRQQRLELKDSGQRGHRRLPTTLESPTRLGSLRPRLIEAMKAYQGSCSEPFSHCVVASKRRTREALGGGRQQLFGIGKQSALEEHLSAPQLRDAVVLIRGRDTGLLHRQQSTRQVTQCVLSIAKVVERERDEPWVAQGDSVCPRLLVVAKGLIELPDSLYTAPLFRYAVARSRWSVRPGARTASVRCPRAWRL